MPNELKEIKVSEVLLHLKNGVTRWKKEDLGFGSLEEIYDLSFTEVKELINHPKIKGVKTKIPTLKIIDDITSEETIEETDVETTKIEVAVPVITSNKSSTPLIVKTDEVIEEEVSTVPFI